MMKEGGNLKVYILASGSKGNITYLKVGHIKAFIDIGISYQKVKKKMDAYLEPIEDVKALFLTHEHHDHTMGLLTLLKKGHIIDVFMTEGTFQSLSNDVQELIPNLHIIKADQPFTYDELEITPFMISHDAKEPIGYVITHHNKKIVHLTDTGYVDQSYYSILENADLYVLESNHNPTKLMASPRPFLLKKRILSEKGHLSNEDACWLMNRFVKDKAIWVVSHISEDCNSVLDIEEAIIKIFDDPTKIEIYYASQEGLPVIEL